MGRVDYTYRRREEIEDRMREEVKNGWMDGQTDGWNARAASVRGLFSTIKSIFHTRHLSYTRDNGCVWRYGINISR